MLMVSTPLPRLVVAVVCRYGARAGARVGGVVGPARPRWFLMAAGDVAAGCGGGAGFFPMWSRSFRVRSLGSPFELQLPSLILVPRHARHARHRPAGGVLFVPSYIPPPTPDPCVISQLCIQTSYIYPLGKIGIDVASQLRRHSYPPWCLHLSAFHLGPPAFDTPRIRYRPPFVGSSLARTSYAPPLDPVFAPRILVGLARPR